MMRTMNKLSIRTLFIRRVPAIVSYITALLAAPGFPSSCQTVPVTGRARLSIVPSSSILPMSFNSYAEFLSKHKVIENTPQAQSVKRVGVRIQHAVEQYMSERNISDRLKEYQGEFNLVEDEQINAWCMPGSKVVVYSGILPVAEDETGLAVVMGHGIGHAIANHGGERIRQELLQRWAA